MNYDFIITILDEHNESSILLAEKLKPKEIIYLYKKDEELKVLNSLRQFYLNKFPNCNFSDEKLGKDIISSIEEIIKRMKSKNTAICLNQGDKKDILISAPLRSVDDVQDIMYEDNGQVKVDRKLGKYTFTGDEKITKWADSPNACWFTIRNSFKINYGANNSGTELLCDNFRPYNHGEFSAQTTINNSVTGITAFEDYFTIRIEKSKLSTQDIDGFKAWLKANPTTIVYQLATPTIEIVENCVDIDLDTFQDKTYFNILNSMPGILDFKIPSNLASIVQSHTKDIKILYDLIDRLLIPNLIENKSDLALLSLK